VKCLYQSNKPSSCFVKKKKERKEEKKRRERANLGNGKLPLAPQSIEKYRDKTRMVS